MPIRACPHCARRLPYAGRRCIHCGWITGITDTPGRSGATRRRQARVWAVGVVMLVMLAVHFAYRNATELADWYMTLATRFLPAGASMSDPDDPEGAYFYCARQVARKMDRKLSVQTFDAGGKRTVALGEGRYRIDSVVDEVRDTGEEVRHDFSCTVRLERGRWVLEELKLHAYESGAVASSQLPLVSPARLATGNR